MRRSVAAPPRAFDYTSAMREVVEDICATLPELAHIRLQAVLLTVAQARLKSAHGVYAGCFPMRFEGGALETAERGVRYRMPRLQYEGREILYLVSFTLPRFQDELDYAEKLATIIHELYHISPEFNGDIRRFPGKNFAHGHSREAYHGAMRRLAARYAASSSRGRGFEFLKLRFGELQARYGGVVGRTVARPRPLRVE